MPRRSRARTSRRSRFRPDGEGKHATQFGQAVEIPFQEGLQDGFGIAVRLKFSSARPQLLAQLGVVINFAVEDDGVIAVFAAKRLIAGLQVDDFQPDCAERDQRRTGRRTADRALDEPDR